MHLLAHLGIFFVLLVRPGTKHGAREDVTTIAVLAIVLVIAIGIGAESVDHLLARPDHDASPLAMAMSLLGLGANLLAAWLFRDPARERFSFRAALAHELADASLTIVGLAGAGLIAIAGWWWIDPGLSLLIAAWLLVWASRLLVLRHREGPAAWARHA